MIDRAAILGFQDEINSRILRIQGQWHCLCWRMHTVEVTDINYFSLAKCTNSDIFTNTCNQTAGIEPCRAGPIVHLIRIIKYKYNMSYSM